VCCKSSFGALLLQEFRKLAAGVFATAVRPETLDFDVVLSSSPCGKSLVLVHEREHDAPPPNEGELAWDPGGKSLREKDFDSNGLLRKERRSGH
jgi:hypothetical protein